MNEADNFSSQANEVDAVCDPISDLEQEIEADTECSGETNDELALLRNEVKMLREQLDEREKLDSVNSKINAELIQLYDCFPDTSLEEIPDEIWQKVKKGASLSAEYALFKRKQEISQKRIGDFNEKNKKMSTGSLGTGEGERYYSPSEVKKMSPAQVKANYDDIIESMRHWN